MYLKGWIFLYVNYTSVKLILKSLSNLISLMIRDDFFIDKTEIDLNNFRYPAPSFTIVNYEDLRYLLKILFL